MLKKNSTYTRSQFFALLKPAQRIHYLKHPSLLPVFADEIMPVKKKVDTGVKKSVYAASVYPHKIYTYAQPADGFRYGAKFEANKKNLLDNQHHGIISEKARRKIENGINWLLFNAKPKRVWCNDSQQAFTFRINLITLTLPAKQAHKDEEITKVCLNNFLNVCRKNAGLENYLWRAEAQLNGNIHYHITTDIFIHHTLVRKWWNQSVQLLGYVSQFKKKFGHDNPNSTDIHSVKHVRRIAAYISKYLAKDKTFLPIGELREHKGKRFEVLYGSDQYRKELRNQKKGKVVGSIIAGPVRKLSGRLWFCSRSVSKSKPLIINEHAYQWTALQDVIKMGEFFSRKTDFVHCYYGGVVAHTKKNSVGLYYDLLKHASGELVEYGFSDDKVLQYM